MRVCFISEAKTIHTQRWTRALSQCGCDIHLISSSSGDIPNIKLYQVPIYSQNLLKQRKQKLQIRNLIRKIGPDIIHLFGLFSLSSLGTMGVVKNFGNLIISVWGSDIVTTRNLESVKSKIIKRYLLNQGKMLLATSDYLAEETRKYCHSNKTITVLPWGVDLEVFRPTDERKHRSSFRIGFAKRLHELAGPDVLLKAFQDVVHKCDRKLVLAIAGDGPMKNYLQHESLKLGLGENIQWLGWLDQPQKLSAFYKSLDIFVMPSRVESFGVAAVEALASGIPVIASQCGGIPEIVKHGNNGLLVAPESPNDLARAIISMVKNDLLRETMGKNARLIAETRFSWNVSLNRMIEIYSKVIAGK